MAACMRMCWVHTCGCMHMCWVHAHVLGGRTCAGCTHVGACICIHMCWVHACGCMLMCLVHACGCMLMCLVHAFECMHMCGVHTYECSACMLGSMGKWWACARVFRVCMCVHAPLSFPSLLSSPSPVGCPGPYRTGTASVTRSSLCMPAFPIKPYPPPRCPGPSRMGTASVMGSSLEFYVAALAPS